MTPEGQKMLNNWIDHCLPLWKISL
jgi:hypothetical protein